MRRHRPRPALAAPFRPGVAGSAARTIAATAAAPRRRAGPLLAVGRRRDAVDAGRVVAAAHCRAPADVPGRRRRSRRRVFALRRPKGRPGGADAADGRAPRHRRRRAPMAPPGPGGDVRVDAQQGRQDRPRRCSGAHLNPSCCVLQPRHERPVAWPPRRRRSRPGTLCARAGARVRQPRRSGCIASRSTEIPVQRYTRTLPQSSSSAPAAAGNCRSALGTNIRGSRLN